MIIADLNEQGRDSAERWHGDSGFDYSFPQLLSNPRFPIQRMAVHDGKIIGALAAKVEAEVYLWLDPQWGTPEERWAAVKMFHNDVTSKAAVIGFDQLYAVLPPEVAKSFGPRLIDLGWQESRPWPKFVYELRA